jgi:lysophospholipase L1-like esterase
VASGAISAFYTPRDKTVQLQYLKQPGGGSFQILRNQHGSLVTTINTHSETRGVGTFEFTLAPNEFQYTVNPLAGTPFTVLGQNNIRSTPGVRVHRAANGGWGVNNFLQRDFTFNQQLQLLDTDLVMVWLGQNDQSFTRTTYAERLNLLVNRIQSSVPDAEIVLIGTYDQGSELLEGVVEAMGDVATQRDLGFINIYGTAGDADFFNDNGYLDDGIHFSEAGGAYLGQFLFDAFMTDGASLENRTSGIPEPTSLLSVFAASALLSRRRG